MCSSPTHDAVGAGAGLLTLALLADPGIHHAAVLAEIVGPLDSHTQAVILAAGVIVAVYCTVTMGLGQARAQLRQRREDEPNVEPRKALRTQLRARGMDWKEADRMAFKQIPRPRWKGPRKAESDRSRLIATAALVLSAWPVAISYATSRLPDQAEFGGIDHRTVTHWLVTNLALLAGLWFALLACGVDPSMSGTVVLFAGVGIGGHLVADMISRGGLPVLWPLIRKDLFLLPKRLRLRVGSVVDAGLMLTVSTGTVWLALSMGGWA